jgi:DNA-binding XRE family transcriptional regulator
MKASKRQKLQKKGWKVGSPADFLGLSPEEEALVAMKLDLVGGIRSLRARNQITQAAFARRLGSSQSRVAKLEAGDRSVSIDLLMRALLNLGASKKQIAAMIGTNAAAGAASPRRRRAA